MFLCMYMCECLRVCVSFSVPCPYFLPRCLFSFSISLFLFFKITSTNLRLIIKPSSIHGSSHTLHFIIHIFYCFSFYICPWNCSSPFSACYRRLYLIYLFISSVWLFQRLLTCPLILQMISLYVDMLLFLLLNWTEILKLNISNVIIIMYSFFFFRSIATDICILAYKVGTWLTDDWGKS